MYANVTGLQTPLSSGASDSSNPILTNGLTRGAVGLQSDHGATLNVQRYLDAAATIPIGAVITAALSAGTPNAVSWSDGVPCGSIVIQVVNSAGAVANLTNVTCLLSP